LGSCCNQRTKGFFMQKIMREIKFRAWNTRELVYLFHDKENKLMIPCSAGVLWLNPSIKDNNYVIKKEHFIMEQFTGRKDISGSDLYTGDKVRARYGRHHNDPKGKVREGVIEFDQASASFVIAIIDSKVKVSFPIVIDFEIIGNIHEPKL
jgi:hypothetical protein